jgi:transcription initiation factor TFIIIB Brf1 subunit/transcription initiation factor TFIIB
LSILNRISPEEIAIAAKTIWSNHLIAKAIGEETIDIIMKTHTRKFSFFNGKTSRGLVGGLFYLLGYKYDSTKNQKELAYSLGTSDVTIRASYRGWLEEFPDLFQDVMGKLVNDQNLRWYVLVDLRRKLSARQLYAASGNKY